VTRAGNPPIETIGVVDIYAPTSTPYFRLKWPEPDGTPGDTSGGRTLDGARLKAVEIDARVGSAAGPFAVTRLDVMRDQFLAEATSPYTGDPWELSQLTQVRIRMNRMLRGQENDRAMDVDRSLCDKMRARGGTRNMVKQNTSVLRAFLRWGHQHENKYFTAEQAELLPDGISMPSPSIKGTAMPKRRKRARAVGESEEYVRPEDAPSAAQVVRLRQELTVSFPRWGELAVELAADAGPRWGEEMQLTAYDVHLSGCAAYDDPHIHIDWQIDAGATAKTPGGRRCRPKGGKTRTTGVHEFSFTGFPVRDALRARVEAALKEQQAGSNPQALLFPAQRGGLLWYTSFEAKALLPAMRRAGWPLQSWTEVRDKWSEDTRQYTRIELDRTTALLPWHSLRHRFARTMIDVHQASKGQLMALGGWENEQTVSNRYYKTGKEHTTSGLALFG